MKKSKKKRKNVVADSMGRIPAVSQKEESGRKISKVPTGKKGLTFRSPQ